MFEDSLNVNSPEEDLTSDDFNGSENMDDLMNSDVSTCSSDSDTSSISDAELGERYLLVLVEIILNSSIFQHC